MPLFQVNRAGGWPADQYAQRWVFGEVFESADPACLVAVEQGYLTLVDAAAIDATVGSLPDGVDQGVQVSDFTAGADAVPLPDPSAKKK